MKTTYDRRGNYCVCIGALGYVWLGRTTDAPGDIEDLEAAFATTDTWGALPARFVSAPIVSVLGVHCFSNTLREVVQWCAPDAQVDVAAAEFRGVPAVLIRSHDRVAALAACDAKGSEDVEVLV